ncbi:MAG: hypothetical protein IPJ77_00810 [Planctomycetes bacterium]|nr:hypothetical protein [Planctomycetota bacterium]
MSSPRFLTALGTALFALGVQAHADLITWGSVQNATSPTEVSTSGVLVTARNLWNTTSASPTVNGVTFSAFGPTGWTQGGNLVLDGGTSGDANYDTLMNTSRATSEATLTNPTGWGGIRLDTLGSFALGGTYEIQVWFCDDRPGTAPNTFNDRVMTRSSATGAATIGTDGIVSNLGTLTVGTASGAMDADPNNTSGVTDTVFGSYVIGTFTRTSSDQLWLLCQGTHPDPLATLRPHINAFQIRDLSPQTPDVITWGTVQDATGPTEVSLNGTLITAKNCWNTTSASPTVNGVLFSAFSPTGWGNGGNNVLNGSTSGDAGYDTLMNTSRGTSEATLTNPTGWGGIRLDSLGALTIGRTYEVQVWFCDDRPGTGTAAINDRVMVFSSASGPASIGSTGIVSNLGSLTQGPLSGPLEADPNNASGAGDTVFGQWVIGTFTRTGTTQLWLLEQGSHPNLANTLRPHINAFQIRELPPPPPSTPFCFGDGTLADHTTPCPCANNGNSGNGCANSVNAAGANLATTGAAATDDLVLVGSGMPLTVSCIYLQGTVMDDVVFGDGVRCTGGTLLRLRTKTNVGGASSFPDSVETVTLSQRGGVTVGSGVTRYYQTYYRNSAALFCPPETFNVTNGQVVIW